MRMPWTSKPKPEPAPTERRREAKWCATCRSPFGPFVHMENERDYCESCAAQIKRTMGLQVIERRKDEAELLG